MISITDARILQLLLALLLGVLSAAPAPAEAPASRPHSQAAEELVVKANGEGADPASAKADATREALRQAVGMFVDAQTVVKDDEVISDKILSATNALVLGSKVVSGPKRRSDGLYEVECEVKIRRQQLVSAIGSAGIAMTGSIDGDAAKRVSEINFRNEQEAQELLRGRLASLWSKLVVARMIDDKGVPLGEGELPTVVQRADGTVVVCANLQVYFHLEAYYTKFLPDLKRLLTAIAKGGEPTRWNTNRPVWQANSPNPYFTRFGRVPVQLRHRERELRTETTDPATTGRMLWLCDGRDESALNAHFVGYRMPAAFLPLLEETEAQVASGLILVELLTEGDRVIHSRLVDVRRSRGAFAMMPKSTSERLENQLVTIDAVNFRKTEGFLIWSSVGFVVDPIFRIEGYPDYDGWDTWGGSSTGVCDALEIRVEIVMPASDLAAVKGYRLTAVEGTPAQR